MSTVLSCNLNKVALLRNSRDGFGPDPLQAARICMAAGAGGLTLHPRADARHATLEDVRNFARLPEVVRGAIELNVEGDLRPDLMAVVAEVGAHQFTVVPVEPGEKTSHRGWSLRDDQAALIAAVRGFQPRTRISVFVDADPDSVELAARSGAAAVEFYTGPYAVAFGSADAGRWLDALAMAAERARTLGLRINAGHDLTPANLGALIKAVRPQEVSIGHGLISDALWIGLEASVAGYLAAIRQVWSTIDEASA